jgi:uncharacterized protein (DUF302 family)
MPNYYSRTLKIPFEEAVSKITHTLQLQGFGIVSSLDMAEIFQKKLNLGFRKYKILGACNPEFAYKAVSLESHIGLKLPCNVLVQEHENGDVEISAINPLESIEDMSNTVLLSSIASEVSHRLRLAVDDLHRQTSEPEHPEALPEASTVESNRSAMLNICF